ncbi:MAG: universal stress protein [Anaerolineales bacterium]
MFKHILIPLDGSAISERAIAPALKIGELEGSRVTLLRAPIVGVAFVPTAELYGNYSLRGLDATLAHNRREALDYLKTIERTLARPNLTLESIVADGSPANAILTTAERLKADLIVMSTHGYSGVTRWIMGSVTERVLGHAACPVLVIRSEAPLNRMLIPLDGSPFSEKALAPALEVASAFGASVALLRAIEEIPQWQLEEFERAEHGLGLRARDELAQAAEAYLDELVKTRVPRNMKVNRIIRTEPAASAILEYAESFDIDVVVMATHGLSEVRKWIYGSVTEKVLRNSQGFSMLVVRP